MCAVVNLTCFYVTGALLVFQYVHCTCSSKRMFVLSTRSASSNVLHHQLLQIVDPCIGACCRACTKGSAELSNNLVIFSLARPHLSTLAPPTHIRLVIIHDGCSTGRSDVLPNGIVLLLGLSFLIFWSPAVPLRTFL